MGRSQPAEPRGTGGRFPFFLTDAAAGEQPRRAAQAPHAAGGSMTVNKILIWDRLVEILGPAAAGATPTDLAVAAPQHLDAAIETVRARLGQRGLLPEDGTFVNVFA